MISQVRRLTIALRSIIRCGRRRSSAAAGRMRSPDVTVAAVMGDPSLRASDEAPAEERLRAACVAGERNERHFSSLVVNVRRQIK